MVVSLEEMKTYLRIDFPDDDALLASMIGTAEHLCADILRTESLSESEGSKVAVMYATAYLYEHREEADHHALTLTLRAMLFGGRKAVF
nr:MAG TPA: Head Tail Connector Protein [Caudoviricetes sp.]